MMKSKNDELAVKAGCYFDVDAAMRVRRFFENFLCHSKGKFNGEQFKLISWQWKELIAPAFGWKRANGLRRFKKVYCEIPKKNGKSTISAGIALYLLVADKEAGAEVYSVAGDKEQASIVYKEAVNMVKASPELSERLVIVNSKKTIEYPDTRSEYRVLSSDASTKEGYNTHGLIFDEYHVQKNDDLRGVLEYSGASRDQPLFVFITTAGEDELSPCYREREYAIMVKKGEVEDTTYLPLIYGLEKDDDWMDVKNWYKANPSLGVTLPLESFKDDFNSVKNKPRELGRFKRYRLNIWTNEETKWINLDDWDACKGEGIELEEGEDVYAAIDLASTQDTNSVIYFFPRLKYFMLRAWVPEECNLKRVEDHRFRYDTFIKRKELIECPGQIMDHKLIFEDVTAMANMFNMKQIGCDPYNASHLCLDLKAEGLPIQYYRQTFANLSNPSKLFEKLIIEHKLLHDGNKLFKWMVKNALVDQDKMENIRPSKGKSKEKIDGVVASVMALGLWLNDELGGQPDIRELGEKKND